MRYCQPSQQRCRGFGWGLSSRYVVSLFTFLRLIAPIDVFIVCDDGKGGKTYQIWVNAKSNGFFLSQQGALPAGTQTISFADIGKSSINIE